MSSSAYRGRPTTNPPQNPPRPIAPPYHTLVIGAGQAGLAAAYYLARAGHPYAVLEAHDRIGDSWRHRWAGLRLFSPQRYNALPGLAPPGGEWHLPDRLEAADYLENYAQYHGLDVRCGEAVNAVEPAGDEFRVVTSRGEYRSRNVIVASGAYRTPRVPGAVAASLPEVWPQFHASELRAVDELAGANRAVLVVGAGASGQQISRLLLQRGTAVLLAGPRVANIPRRVLGRDAYWWLYKSGLITVRTDRAPGKWLGGAAGAKGDVTVGEEQDPVTDYPNLTRVVNHLVRHDGAGRLVFRCARTTPEPLAWPPAGRRPAVVWCTGYRNQYPWLPQAVLAEDQTLLPRPRPFASALPGLYFLGLPNLRRTNSSLMGGVGEDAGVLVRSLESRV